ncbi:MAG: type II toxin-antitoxin system VapC family toxin [Candidatus Nitrosotenuis sp.]
MISRLVCADTNFLIALERNEADALAKLKELEKSGEMVYITSVNVAEYFGGAYGAKNKIKALKDAKEMLDRFSILNLDYESARIWGELSSSLKSGTIGDRDLFILSISLANKQVLLTKNKKHFERVAGLRVETW